MIGSIQTFRRTHLHAWGHQYVPVYWWSPFWSLIRLRGWMGSMGLRIPQSCATAGGKWGRTHGSHTPPPAPASDTEVLRSQAADRFHQKPGSG